MNIKFFNEVNENDIVGGKGSSLAKMYQSKFNVPNGYIITVDAFNNFLIENNVKIKIEKLIAECNINNEETIKEVSKKINDIILNCKISDKLENEIFENYEKLDCDYVAVRSSATSEDGKNHAWAGQLETFLNVTKNNIIDTIKKCWSSIFSKRALFYRVKNNDTSEISVAVVIQKMLQSEISGVAFSVNPTNNNKNEIVIESAFGLGEAIVSGKVTPDKYIVYKDDISIKIKEIKVQKVKFVKADKFNKWIEIKDGNLQKLNDELIIELSMLIKKIESFYGFPIDVEWGIENDKIYILQCRPITTIQENELLEDIKKKGKWNFYVSRKFNWFVENTEIYATMEKFQKELLGFELITQNYLCLNGDEYALDEDFNNLCNKLDNYFKNDNDFFEKFAKIEFKLVEEIKEYLEYLSNRELFSLSYDELLQEFKRFNNIYIKSFIPGMTRPEDYLTYKLEKELIAENFSKQDIEKIFKKISTCPNYYPLSYSEEPLDLLKIALESKDQNIEKLLDNHIKKYSWIKGPVEFEDTVFTKKDYLERLEILKDIDIEAKIKNINDVRNINDIEYEAILTQYNFSQTNKKIIKAIRDFIFLRTYTTEFSDHLFFMGRHTIFKEISNRTNINDKDLIMLNDKEILNILECHGKISKEIEIILENRKIGFAMVWIDGNVKTVFGKESIELQEEIAKIYKISEEKIDVKNNIIFGSIANKGKVTGIARILKSYNDIYNVKKGDIIVATMTTPDYVSAMEKASGFITDEGGITCHAAIISREFNVPCIVVTVDAIKKIKDGQKIELDAYTGKIYILD